MGSAVVQLLVLAAIAVFLILRLRSVLGTRDGFEAPPTPRQVPGNARDNFEVIEGGVDRDITDHVDEGSDAAQALSSMKRIDNTFSVTEFLSGARGAYEMILMAFERGELRDIKGFLSPEVFEAFDQVVTERANNGLRVDANFVGVREIALADATFDDDSKVAEVTVRFVGELTSVVFDENDKIVEGDPTEIKRHKDRWTFARDMSSNDPNWQLVETGE